MKIKKRALQQFKIKAKLKHQLAMKTLKMLMFPINKRNLIYIKLIYKFPIHSFVQRFLENSEVTKELDQNVEVDIKKKSHLKRIKLEENS